MTDHPFRDPLFKRAATLGRTILFPDAEDERTLRAVSRLHRDRIVMPRLVGNPERINAINGGGQLEVPIIDPAASPLFGSFVDELFLLRKVKGMTRSDATARLHDPLYFSLMMVRRGLAEGVVTGSLSTTSSVLRAAIQVIGIAESARIVSSFFLMLFPTRVLSFADCGVVPDPTADELSAIAITTADNHLLLTGEEPRVALLSFSTLGSADHPSVTKVRDATAIAQRSRPDLLIDGEFQFDAAINPAVAARKAPHSRIAGAANVLIFPDLNAGNIAYKMAERFGGAQALGPIVQGLKKPVSDLSRGCSIDDIIAVAAVNAIMGGSND